MIAKQESVKLIMDEVNEWESNCKGHFIKDLLNMLDPVTLNLVKQNLGIQDPIIVGTNHDGHDV